MAEEEELVLVIFCVNHLESQLEFSPLKKTSTQLSNRNTSIPLLFAEITFEYSVITKKLFTEKVRCCEQSMDLSRILCQIPALKFNVRHNVEGKFQICWGPKVNDLWPTTWNMWYLSNLLFCPKIEIKIEIVLFCQFMQLFLSTDVGEEVNKFSYIFPSTKEKVWT